MTFSVLIVEDQGIASAGVKFTLETYEQFSVLHEATTCKRARAILQTETPDLIILDVILPDGSGLDLLAEIRSWSRSNELAPGKKAPKILVYSGQANPQEFAAAKRLGADALLSKSDPPKELVTALQQMIEGVPYISLTVKRMLALSSESDITEREQQVLQLLFLGLNNKEMAQRLNISAATVRKHRENILSKLQAHNTVSAIRAGLRLGLIDVSSH